MRSKTIAQIVFVSIIALLIFGQLPILADEYILVAKWGDINQFRYPSGITVDAFGNIFVADTNNRRIQKFKSPGEFITSWSGMFYSPFGVATDNLGNVFVTDQSLNNIQKFTNSGGFITKWGNYTVFFRPSGVAVDASGNVYVADTYNNRIQKFTGSGEFISSWGTFGSDNGTFNLPSGIAIDTSGNVYVADTNNNRIQKFTGSGEFISSWGTFGSDNGTFNLPSGIAVDASGNVYVADTYNHRVQKFTGSGFFLTSWGVYGYGDAQFRFPKGLTVDVSGNVYVTDTYNNRIQVFAPTTSNEPPIVDTTPPNIEIISPEVRDYLHTDSLVIDFNVEDDISGAEDITLSVMLDDIQVMDGDIVNLLDFSLGNHVFNVSATDEAGNSAEKEVIFNIVATIGSISTAVDIFADDGKINNEKMSNSLKAILDAAQSKIDQGKPTVAMVILKAFINHVEAQSGKHINVETADTLISDAEYVINDLQINQAPTLAISREPWLGQNYPNPFNPETWIPYNLSENADVRIKIYNSIGQLVKTLELGHKSAGLYSNRDNSAYWDGKNEYGEPVTSGVYFYSIQAGSFNATKKMMVLE